MVVVCEMVQMKTKVKGRTYSKVVSELSRDRGRLEKPQHMKRTNEKMGQKRKRDTTSFK